jgi:hypothetical protein
VTGSVLDALESSRMQVAVRESADGEAPRRTALLSEITEAQQRRGEARGDYPKRTID